MITLTEGSTEYILEGYTVSQLRKLLAKGTVVVSFRKVSTEQDRIMYCTRRMDLVPKSQHPTGTGGNIPPGNLAVYDLMKKAWRSFRVNRVLKAEPRKLSFLTKALRRQKYKNDHKPGTAELELQPNDTHPDDITPEIRDKIKQQNEPFNDDNDDEDENMRENYVQNAESIVLYEIDKGFKGFYHAK